jgi:peptidoglycan-associated lipoprotein
MKRILTAVLATAILAACGSTPTKEQDGAAVEDRGAASSQPAAKPPATATGPTTKPLDPNAVSGNPLKDPSNVLSKRSIYFELDSNIVKEEFKPLVAAHARYLQQNRGQKMTVQGNTDERGSREYNLALGQRRAEAVRKALEVYGVKAAQIEAVSFGEERPKASGHDEPAWAQNRRADIAYSAAR